MIKHFCDFCDQEKSEKELNQIVLIDRRKLGAGERKDICRECTEKIWKQKIEEVAPVQQSKKAEEPKRTGTEAVSAAGVYDEDFWATHDPSGGDLPTEENKEQDAKKPKRTSTEAAPAAGVEKAQKRKVIDRGKVMALKQAGWSGRKIAEEMKCSEQTICNIISQERKKVENGKI